MDLIRDEISRLASGIEQAKEEHDRSIAAIRAWKKEQDGEIDEMERQLKLRYDGTVIDTDLLKLQKDVELHERQVQERIKKDREECEALSREIDDFLKNNTSK